MSDLQVPVNINEHRVREAMTIAIKSVGQGNFEVHEVIFGFAEAIGRAIQAQDINPMAKAELVGYAARHMVETVKAGMEAMGQGNSSNVIQ